MKLLVLVGGGGGWGGRNLIFTNSMMAMEQGKQGIWFLPFPDTENTGNFAVTLEQIWRDKENMLNFIINIKSVCVCVFLNFKIFSLTLLSIIFNFKVLCTFVPTCYMYIIYPT